MEGSDSNLAVSKLLVVKETIKFGQIQVLCVSQNAECSAAVDDGAMSIFAPRSTSR